MKATLLIIALVCLAGVSARTSSGCHPSMYSYVAGKICMNCPADCATCDSTGKLCTACKNGDDPVDGRCPTLNINWACAEALCDVEGTQGCSLCNDGYRFAMKDATTATSYCVACTQAGCADCTVDACNACLDGWYMDTAAKACKQCDAGCVSCDGAGSCKECGAAFFADAGKCTACSAGCVECESATKCTTCANEYLLSSTAFTCTQSPGCETQTDDGTKCSVCKDGYRLVSTDGSCKQCDSNAALCDSATDGSQIIISCSHNFILATKTTDKAAACQARVGSYCTDQTAAGTCTKCDTAAGANLSAGTCKLCSQISTGCSKCSDGNATDAAVCTACSDGYYLGSTGCVQCDTSCVTCTDTTCKCKDGYVDTSPASAKCTSCDAGLAKYGCTNRHAGSGCVTGAGEYTHGICFACDPAYKCITCTSYQVCASCAAGSSIKDNKCVVCDANCSSSAGGAASTGSCATSGAGKCDLTTCVKDYYINLTTKQCSNKCGVSNCKTCSTSDYAKCGTCNDGYYKDANGACVGCPTNCATCTSGTVCQQCKGGYMIDSKASPAKEDCSLKCDTTNITKPANFVSDNVDSCTAGSVTKELSALVCKTGYIPYSDFLKCVVSTTITGCKEIDGAAPAKCKTCNAGYVISSTGTCIPCSSDSSFNVDKYASCTQASDKVDAATCATGYVQGGSAVDASKCFLADSKCTYTLATAAKQDVKITADSLCENGTCVDGYYLSANKCVACPTGCTKCTSATDCSACATDYVQTTSTNKTCSKMTAANCQTVGVTADVCQTCKTGFYLASGSCSACGSGCTCSASTDTCTGCLTGYTKDLTYTGTSPSQKCSACIKNCSACSAVDTCDTCKDPYYKQADGKACLPCPDNASSCTSATAVTCKSGFQVYTLPTDATGAAINPVKFCVACAANCDACTIDTAGASTCTKCKLNAASKLFYYLSADAKSCSNDSCAGSDGLKCNKCTYGFKLSATDLKCVDCVADNSCPLSCSATGGSTGGSTGGVTNNSTSATDSGSKIAFSMFILAFIAILGHMMI